eukprot:SAG31_NODE_11495_length_1024_cov_1.150270_1_plen_60_part_01
MQLGRGDQSERLRDFKMWWWQCSLGPAGRILLLTMQLSLWACGLGVTLSNEEARRDTEGR